ncbi:N-formylglutamate amidohydrolase [Frateuria defendens]|uniref:N-formylglutamate amidohydrolase n=1 Tax=Frateuria defendens TaxID=2219559 RepID=UPI00066FB6B1|nr:N-formylglutamate amidohydrolase [Frateuria defendens]
MPDSAEPHSDAVRRLLADDEPAPFTVHRPDAGSPFFLTCDHAGRLVPRRLRALGLPASELERHIAWDIGAEGLARVLAGRLDAWLICQTYSRLVIDCNRPFESPTSIPLRSERTDVPGNRDLDAAAVAARREEIFLPYHRRTEDELDRRAALGRPTILVTVHSFTPVYLDEERAWQLGVLYQRDARLAHALLALMREDGRWTVGDNQPYAVSDASDYAIPVYGERRGLPHVELEVRQDLIADEAGQREWGERIAAWLVEAARRAGLIQVGDAPALAGAIHRREPA